MKRTMNQMKKIMTGLMLSTLAVGTMAFAGGDTVGHGGGVQYCPQPIGDQQKYEAYDLKEIKNHIIASRRRSVDRYDGISTKEDYFNRAIAKVKKSSPELADAIVRARNFYNENHEPTGTRKLESVPDFDSFSIDKNCVYQQLVNWKEPEEMLKEFGVKELHILRDDDLYGFLDPLSQAANDFHEASYRVRRAFGLDNDTGSNFVRMFTGQVFSTGEIDADLFPKISLYGQTEYNGSFLYVTKSPCDKPIVFTITNLGGLKIGNGYVVKAHQSKNVSGKEVLDKIKYVTFDSEVGFTGGFTDWAHFNGRRNDFKVEASACGETHQFAPGFYGVNSYTHAYVHVIVVPAPI